VIPSIKTLALLPFVGKWTAKDLRTLLESSDAQERLWLEENDPTPLRQVLDKYSYAPVTAETKIDALLDCANIMLNGFGVEALSTDGGWFGHYYQNIAALYVNRGDTYDTTFIYDVEKDRFLVSDWGTCVEVWERSRHYQF